MLRFGSFIAGAFAIAFGIASGVHAAPITFTATGSPDVVGSVTFDDSLFDGTEDQQISNSTILALSLTVLGVTFDLDDVVDVGATVFDSSGPSPIIVDGSNNLAGNGAGQVIFFIQGDDGDAALAFLDLVADDSVILEVRWIVADLVDVLEPGTLALFGAGLAGLGWFRRKRAAA